MRRPARRYLVYLLALIVVLVLAGCNFSRATPTPDRFATLAAETVSAELTLAAQQTPEETATPTPPLATDTPSPTQTVAGPSPTEGSAGCTDRVTFVSDVTIPDNTHMSPGETFTKTWRLRNSGTCTWTSEYDLVFDGGNAMSGPAAKALPGNVAPNSTVDISIDLTAPASNGTHRGNYKLRNADGILFGIGTSANTAFWVQIVVGPTPTPTLGVYNQGKVTVDPTFRADLDEIEQTSSGADFWYRNVSAVERYIVPQNGATFREMTGIPSYDDCRTASLSSSDISFDTFSVGSWFCFLTDEGRYGRFEVESLSGSPPDLGIDVRTWTSP